MAATAALSHYACSAFAVPTGVSEAVAENGWKASNKQLANCSSGPRCSPAAAGRYREPKCIRQPQAAAGRLVRGGGLRLRLAARWSRASDLTIAVSRLNALARG